MLRLLTSTAKSAQVLLDEARDWHREAVAGDLLAPTPHAVVWEEGTASLLKFYPGRSRQRRTPILLVPSIINRWYVLDLRAGSSVAEALTDAGHDVYCLDWGVPRDEDRYFGWDDILARLSRVARVVRRHHGSDEVALLGYCVGATLSAIHSALEPKGIAALINLAGPVDFAHAGMLGQLVDERWFDARAVAAAGNISGSQMQSGFLALRPTGNIGKWVTLADRADNPAARDAFTALEAWASDNVPFPAAAYATYITELYQKNALVRGAHRARGRTVDLAAIDCPVLTIGASRDTICPLPAAEALAGFTRSQDAETIVVAGGHVGAVVGSRAARELYPQLKAWLDARLPRVEGATDVH